MKVDITGRHIEVTRALREYTADKLRKLERLLDGPLEAHAVLAIEKHRHMAEIQVKSRHAVFAATQESLDLYQSIGEAADKLERQALKHKEKVRGRKHRKSARETATPRALSPQQRELPRVVRSSRYRLKPLSTEDAVLELESSGQDLLVFRDAETYRVNVVYRQADGNYGLIDPEF
ncbi:MAG TPA: ribosome-associated translation inhibitor RaiA [Candidatus Polarisedimenticolaceae bacterium]|nr:ribosome-associated translation inhibitor RaiA [Candidatus Polarisedimenticolaceae bacterium]